MKVAFHLNSQNFISQAVNHSLNFHFTVLFRTPSKRDNFEEWIGGPKIWLWEEAPGPDRGNFHLQTGGCQAGVGHRTLYQWPLQQTKGELYQEFFQWGCRYAQCRLLFVLLPTGKLEWDGLRPKQLWAFAQCLCFLFLFCSPNWLVAVHHIFSNRFCPFSGAANNYVKERYP